MLVCQLTAGICRAPGVESRSVNAYLRPDGGIVVPARAESGDGITGDGAVVLRPGDDGYDVWYGWLRDRALALAEDDAGELSLSGSLTGGGAVWRGSGGWVVGLNQMESAEGMPLNPDVPMWVVLDDGTVEVYSVPDGPVFDGVDWDAPL